MKPKGLARIIGLVNIKERARIDIVASHRLREPFPHSLIYGIGGTGKTFFAKCIAEELKYFFVEKEAASLRSRKDIVELLHQSNKRSRGRTLLLFVDEIHRLTPLQQEVFYYPMTEWRVDDGNEHWYKMRPFTLMGATTQIDRLDENSFQKRFQNIWELKPYSIAFMSQIIANLLKEHRIGFVYNDLLRISTVCHGVPRTAKRLCKKIRNHCVAYGRSHITSEDIERVFLLEGLVQ